MYISISNLTLSESKKIVASAKNSPLFSLVKIIKKYRQPPDVFLFIDENSIVIDVAKFMAEKIPSEAHIVFTLEEQ